MNGRKYFLLAAPKNLLQLMRMNDLALSLRQARPSDAADLARIYIDSWHDTYAGILPHNFLSAMSLKTHTARWLRQINSPGTVIVMLSTTVGASSVCQLGSIELANSAR